MLIDDQVGRPRRMKLIIKWAPILWVPFMLILLIGLQGCDLNDPFKGTPFGRNPPREAGQLQLVEAYPEGGLTDVPITSSFRLKFNRSVDQASVKGGIALQPSIALVIEQGADSTEWIVKPVNQLSPDRVYTLQITTSIKDTAGNNLPRPVDLRFRTAYQSQARFGRPIWTADGNYIFFSASFDGGDSWHLWRTPRWGGWKQRVADRVVPFSEVAISPDGRRVAFARLDNNGKSAEVWLCSSDGFNLRQMVDSEELSGPLNIKCAWAPGNDRLALEMGYGTGGTGQDDVTALGVMALDGALLRRIGGANQTYRLLGWSRDGRDVVGLRSPGTADASNLIRYEFINWDLSTGSAAAIEVDATVVNFSGAAQSRDYSSVTFWNWRPVRTPQGNIERVASELWVYRLGSNSVSRLAPTALGNRQGGFSPNGDEVVFNSNRSGEWLIWKVERGGGNLRQVTKGTGSDILPGWSPLNSEIAFISTRGGEEALWVAGADGANPRRVAGRE
ncbi:MAG TPA: hypothetical protein DDZ65_04670 [Firmicutes bacterium]|nr:hypothetical protein [Bacillota bacterium]